MMATLLGIAAAYPETGHEGILNRNTWRYVIRPYG